VGLFLLNNSLNYINKDDVVKSVFLEVRKSNLSAINLYKKENFVKIYERLKYYSDGEDAEVYRLNFDEKNKL